MLVYISQEEKKQRNKSLSYALLAQIRHSAPQRFFGSISFVAVGWKNPHSYK